ncbi:hypothetical protein HS048_14555 [Planomonospora sp. ID91781]|uniref:Lipoprotein n=1 Tax=Planomonospora sphaerica TaxID=161355 RepID=A0A161M7I7_9ACTN|nr:MULTISPECIES: hypothetical protein [Planomonospora]MBG0821959.1 hypothetical protein [Planomonospora sp. ID91781]GAT64913.1 hypothetical protein PS9374_00545 [Planomonospora sphaerica]
MTRRFRMLLVAALALTACSCGNERLAPEIGQEEMAPNDGGNGFQAGIAIRNVILVGDSTGKALASGAGAPLHMVLINNRTAPDRLVAISAPGAFQGAEIPGGGVDLPVRQPVGTGPVPVALLTGASRQLSVGGFVPVELRFQQAGTTRLQVPVMPATEWRATLSPWPSAPAAPSPTSPLNPTPGAPVSPSPTAPVSPSPTG